MTKEARKLIIKCSLSPGDICTLTAAIKSLHLAFPRQYVTDVRTTCDEIFKFNPDITPLDDSDSQVEMVELHYELIHRSDDVVNHFLRGYCDDLGRKLGVSLELMTNRPAIYLSDEEKNWANQVEEHFTHKPTKFWLINAGVKSDFTLKQWPVEYYQEVVDWFRGRIQFVQIGAGEHQHQSLRNVISLVGATDVRQLIRLVYHSEGGLGPITFLQHLCAAFEKPYVALLGGREPVPWVQYPLQTTLHTMGKLPCCRARACWKSRVIRMDDGSEHDHSLCEMPTLGMERPVGKCMAIIKPTDAIRAIEACYDGGRLTY